VPVKNRAYNPFSENPASNQTNFALALNGGLMIRKFSIPFLLCILLLVFSEYYFLHEVTGQRRGGILFLTISGLVSSILLFSFLFKKYRKAAR
jgi:hypothetical protein